MRIGLVAAEPSGDILGAGLIAAIKTQKPEATFEGIGGPQMLAAGMDSWFPMERLSVMGLVEVIRHLPELLSIRRQLVSRWIQNPPDLFIGVDGPDFNLAVERQLREAGVPTAHYVCPSVWAWRQNRVKKIRNAADLVLSIFPFEGPFLAQHGIKSSYVGHPLAQDYPLHPDRSSARDSLGIPTDAPVLAVLPGSRSSEVSKLTEVFLQTALRCSEQLPSLHVVVPLANQKTRRLFEQLKQQHAPALDLLIVENDSKRALAAADVVLVASGTATFEGLLCKRPMVVGYKLHWLTYHLLTTFRMLKIEHVAMANLLVEEGLAPEYIQEQCNPDNLVPAVLNFFENKQLVANIEQRYLQMHESLQTNTNEEAAQAVLALLKS